MLEDTDGLLRPPLHGGRSNPINVISGSQPCYLLLYTDVFANSILMVLLAFKGHDDWIRQLCTGHHSWAMVCNTLRRVRHLAVHAVVGYLKQQYVVANYGYAGFENEFSQLAPRKCSIQTVVLFHHDGTLLLGVIGTCSCLLNSKCVMVHRCARK